MSPLDYTHILTKAVDELSDSQSYQGLFHQHREGEPLPSGKSLQRIVELARSILFPGYFGNSTINSQTINYHIGVNIEELFELLTDQIQAGLCFGVENSGIQEYESPCRATSAKLAAEFISRLPEMRQILATDVEAAYYGDPAATCFGEIICCYPIIRAITNYRIAHELYKLNIPLIPRIITEMAHSETGIDIHPGAQIGHHFTMTTEQELSLVRPASSETMSNCIRESPWEQKVSRWTTTETLSKESLATPFWKTMSLSIPTLPFWGVSPSVKELPSAVTSG